MIGALMDSWLVVTIGMVVWGVVLWIREASKAAEQSSRNLQEVSADTEVDDAYDDDAYDDDDADAWCELSYTVDFDMALDVDESKEVVEELLSNASGFDTVSEGLASHRFQRGDESIEELPTNRRVPWEDVPVELRVRYYAKRDGTHVKVVWNAKEDLVFDDRSKRIFYAKAQNESEEWVAALNARMDSAFSDGSDDEAESWQNDESAADSEQTRKHLDILGVPPGASWEQIQSAYRRLSRQYHPDTIAEDVPPHIAELASRKFQEITFAYQALKTEYVPKR